MISVDGLVAIPSLGLAYAAGRGGGTRLVTWAHVCDLPDPWVWHDVGDLVMTTGSGLPLGAKEQGIWIERLIESKVSALVVALKPDAPELCETLIATADERGFPVLTADFDLHFVQLARTVIETSVQSERTRLAVIDRLYESYWRALHAGASIEERLSVLERVTGWSIEILDADHRHAFARGAESARRSVSDPHSDTTSTTIMGDGSMVLVVEPGRNEIQSRSLLQHVGGLIALELEHHWAQRDRLRHSGEDLLTGLIQETISLPGVWVEFGHRGLGDNIVVACWKLPNDAVVRHEGIQRDVLLQSCAPLFLPRDGTLLGVVPDDPELIDSISRRLGAGCAAGLSARLTVNSSAPEATRQSQLAAERGLESGLPIQSYDELGVSTSLVPGSVEDARRLVDRVLGPLILEDRENFSELVRSVQVFLTNDGAWQRSADQLGIHRQTLVYRMTKVEKLIGLKPTTTKGSALLWLAFEGAERANLEITNHTISADGAR